MSRSPRLAAAVLALLVGGCGVAGDFPSLLPRDVEQLSLEEPIRTDPPIATNPAIRARAASLLAAVRSGDGAFETAYRQALPRARAAGPSGSDSWIIAQEAISRVEAARGPSTAAFAELNTFIIDRADEPTDPADHQAINASLAAAEAIVTDQATRITGLQRLVRR